MSEALLDTIDTAAEEAEEQLLDELKRIRKSADGSTHAAIDEGMNNALNQVVDQLWN